MSEICRKYTLVVRGDDQQAFDEALEVAADSMLDGCLSSAESCDDGAYYFNSTDEVPNGDRPR
jgi:hypothetical protein